MSASEKLKALDAAFSWWSDSEPWTAGMEIYIDSEGEPPVHTFRNALPQIVAVVQQAEYIGVLSPELAAALVALDEQLTGSSATELETPTPQ